MRVLCLLVLVVPACVLGQSFLQRALSDLAQGGRRVCPYCPYCAHASRCGGRCTRPECAACGYRFHCSSTCVTLCLQPEATTPRSTTTTTTTTTSAPTTTAPTTPPATTTPNPTTTTQNTTSPTSPSPATPPPSPSPAPSASPSPPPADATAASPTPPTEDSGCEERGGYCEERSYSCPGRYVFHGGLCADRPGRVCCLPHEEPLCREKGGICRGDARSCPRGYREGGGSCTGPSDKNKRCCLPDNTTPAPTTKMPSTTESSTPLATTTPKATSPPPSRCGKLKMVSRRGWGAKPAKKRTSFARPPSKVVVHHSDGYFRHLFTWSYSSRADYRERVQEIQEDHFDRGFDDIGYNFLIDGFGNVYEGRGWDYSGAHVPCCNSFALGINFLGYFENATPTAAALEAGEDLIACGVERGKIRQGYDLNCHLDLGAASGDTDCPGAALCRYARRRYSGL
ncbi:uncharacterized protein [Branchiostoma lanceolatum]|uniref:uncharacterized protein n=1 Tax=Branchiostoma lanceolatum TaxID=7740 RepID=UPI0034559D48